MVSQGSCSLQSISGGSVGDHRPPDVLRKNPSLWLVQDFAELGGEKVVKILLTFLEQEVSTSASVGASVPDFMDVQVVISGEISYRL